ncbi:Mobile element protein [hydrothermal vent metagenome]|uniref:Mobile element protein n=1 Tax=hydrothermal vent metagenome TaxID=652676 RepID=A0A3B1BF14_9ZZZZ
MKNYTHISNHQRIELATLHRNGNSVSNISKQLKLHRSTVYRELKRNSRLRSSYVSYYANNLAEMRKERFAKNHKFTSQMIILIKEKLENYQWSPEQIHGYCFQNNIPMVSHERIYQYIYQDKEKGGKLFEHLRTGKKKYKKRYGKHKNPKIIIKNKVSIDERPEIINNKERYGDWEIDTIIGKNNKGAIVTIVERKSSFILIRKLKGKNASQLAKETIRLMMPYKELVHSITSDNGTEFANHEYIAKKLKAKFYFAHPYSSWERGLSEYSNKLIRQYVPKKSIFEDFSVKYLNEINNKLNNRPRKTLDFNSPLLVFMDVLNNVALGY